MTLQAGTHWMEMAVALGVPGWASADSILTEWILKIAEKSNIAGKHGWDSTVYLSKVNMEFS